jgi:hypothetical protein
MWPSRPPAAAPALAQEAAFVEVALGRGDGPFTTHRGDGPLGANQYGLSFHSHTGRWEATPFVGELVPLAHDLVTALGPHLERPDFSGGIRGSGH